MYTINLNIILVTFTIKVVTHHTRKTILHYHQPEFVRTALCELLLITEIIDFRNLKVTLVKKKYPAKIIHHSFTKLSQPRKRENNEKIVITFTRTYNLNHQFSSRKFKNCIRSTRKRELQRAFIDKKILLTTRQLKKL